jgi:hypothetical protein
MAYLHHHYEPKNITELLRMHQRVKAYQIIYNTLYKTFVTGPLLYSLGKAKCKKLLSEIHTGICGGHIGSRALAARVFRQRSVGHR